MTTDTQAMGHHRDLGKTLRLFLLNDQERVILVAIVPRKDLMACLFLAVLSLVFPAAVIPQRR